MDLAASLPRPIVTEHILRPLLLSLPQGPNVTLAAISLGNALGSAFVAAHMLPALLAVLACRPSNAPTTSETRSGSMSRSGEQQRDHFCSQTQAPCTHFVLLASHLNVSPSNLTDYKVVIRSVSHACPHDLH